MVVSWSGEARVERSAAAAPEASIWPTPPESGVQSVSPRETSTDFVELYRTHFAYVWKSARRLGVAAAELDDVVQETFLTVHRLFDTYEARGSERSWLFSVLFRIVQRHRRSRGRWAAFAESGADLDEIPGPAAGAPDKSAETKQTVSILEAILDELDPERRAVLVLAEIEEKPVNEIADILGINRHTASSRLRAARMHVEEAMARHRARDGWRYK